MLWRTSRTQAVGICVFECERSQTRGFVKSIAMEWRSSPYIVSKSLPPVARCWSASFCVERNAYHTRYHNMRTRLGRVVVVWQRVRVHLDPERRHP